MRGEELQRVTHCQFGNSSLSPVAEPSTASRAVCVAPPGEGEGGAVPDGTLYAGQSAATLAFGRRLNALAHVGRRGKVLSYMHYTCIIQYAVCSLQSAASSRRYCNM